MSGLFQTLNIGVSGLTAQQGALNTTSHNISNASSDGYSRQRTLIEANRPLASIGFNSPTGAGQVGTGAQVSSIQRVRDAFVDYQVRAYTTLQGENSASEGYLSEVQGIFNEPTDTGISTLMGKFYKAWGTLATNSADTTARTNVVTAASILADQLNNTAAQLQSVKTNINTAIQADVLSTNKILDQVNTLNQQIMTIKFSDNEPNDLMDQRDKLLDQLSAKLGVKLDNKAYYGEDVAPVVQADTAGPADTSLVLSANPTNVKRFSYIDSIVPVSGSATDYTISYYKNGDKSTSNNLVSFNVTLASAVTDPNLQAQQLNTINENRVLWADNSGNATSNVSGVDKVIVPNTTTATTTIQYANLQLLKPVSGEFKGFTQAQQNTDIYIAKLDNFAKVLAFSVNAVLSGVTGPGTEAVAGSGVDAKGVQVKDNMPFFVNSAVAKYNSTNSLTNLGDFSSKDTVLGEEHNITAGNISINKYIISNVNEIKTRTHDNEFASEKNNTKDANGDGKRAQLVAELKSSLMDIAKVGSDSTQIQTREELFGTKGGNKLEGLVFTNNTGGTTLDTYFKDTVAAVASAVETADRNIANQQKLLDTFNQQKQSVSGVSLDEELANMVQFNHAYQANAKVIATVDSLLDVIINGLKK